MVSRTVEVTFPVSKDVLFLGTWGKLKGSEVAPARWVKEMNRRTVVSAQKFVFACERSDGLNRLVQKCRDSSPKMTIS